MLSFHLSFTIAIITGDYRQFHYPVKTTLVSLLGYNFAILYSSLFSLLLSGPSISNPLTSHSFTNHLIIPLASTKRYKAGDRSRIRDKLNNSFRSKANPKLQNRCIYISNYFFSCISNSRRVKNLNIKHNDRPQPCQTYTIPHFLRYTKQRNWAPQGMPRP